MEKMRTRAILKGRRRPGKVAFRVRIPTDRIIRDSFKGQKRNKKSHSISQRFICFPFCICFFMFVCVCVCVCVCRIRNAFVDEKLAVNHTVVLSHFMLHSHDKRQERTDRLFAVFQHFWLNLSSSSFLFFFFFFFFFFFGKSVGETTMWYEPNDWKTLSLHTEGKPVSIFWMFFLSLLCRKLNQFSGSL